MSDHFAVESYNVFGIEYGKAQDSLTITRQCINLKLSFKSNLGGHDGQASQRAAAALKHTDFYPRDRQMPEVGHGPGPPPPRARESDRTARWLRFTPHFTFSGPLLSESENAAIWTALLSAARPSFVSIPAVYNGFFTAP